MNKLEKALLKSPYVYDYVADILNSLEIEETIVNYIAHGVQQDYETQCHNFIKE